MKLRTLVPTVMLLCASITPLAALDGYYRYPAIHGDTVVFSAEGDLFRIDLAGEEPLAAVRLTTHPGGEWRAAISPDGSTVAFTGTYEGPAEVYTMPLTGGLPQRRTWHGDNARVVGWKEEGVLAYATQRHTTLPGWHLVTLDIRSGHEERVPLFDAADGSWDGDTVYFTRYRFQGSHTKRYQGGTAQSIWKFTPGTEEAVLLTGDFAGTDHRPMIRDGRIWFRSDRDGTMNLWSMASDGSGKTQHTFHDGFDVKDPSLGTGKIVYQVGADLWLFDIEANTTRKLQIELPSDFDQMRERWITEPMDWLTAANLSPDGEKLVMTARGQLFVAPAKGGRLVELTRQDGVRYRQGRMLPDNKTVLALSDESGEVEWWSMPADGTDEAKQVTSDGCTLRYDGVASPDGKVVASWNHDQELWLHDLNTGEGKKIAFSPQWGFSTPSWSPDSRWLVYGKAAGNALTRLWLYDTRSGDTVPLTTDRYDSYNALFSPDGKSIYLLSDRTFRSVVGAPWGSRQPEPFFDRSTGIYRIPLKTDDRSPFRPDDELVEPEEPEDEKPKGKKNKKDKEEPEEKSTAPTVIDLKGLTTRLEPVPVPAGNYGSLAVNGERLFWLAYDAGSRQGDLMAMKIDNEDPKPVKIASDLRSYQLSADGKKLLLRKNNTFHVIDASSGKDADLSESAVDLSRWRFPVDPREEWLQMFIESWRLERDHFYDPDMHGVDWMAMLHKYLPLVDRVRSRSDLIDLQSQLAGELSALHTFVRSPDTRKGKDDIRPASLGAELVRDEEAGGYRVEHIYRTDPDIPEELSPLRQPGVNVNEGDVITRVNGVDVLSVPDIAVLLRDQAGRQVRLTVGDRETIVTPVSGGRDAELRYDEWEYTRRLEVEEKGNGKLGYLHLRAMGGNNMTEFHREFYPVIDRQGLVIDARHNRGGNIDSWILSRLMRPVWVHWKPRVGGGSGWRNMQSSFNGHLVLLVDAHTASDGELFAEGFKRLGLGKTIGVRTWGGEIWLNGSNFLVDRGIMTASEFGVYGPEGEWLIEGHGFEPDIVVDNLPHATFNGEDAQLDAAIEHLLKLIEEDPRETPEHPPYPDKSFRPGSLP